MAVTYGSFTTTPQPQVQPTDAVKLVIDIGGTLTAEGSYLEPNTGQIHPR